MKSKPKPTYKHIQQLFTCVCVHIIVHNCHTQHSTELASSSLTSPFSTNMAISETKGQGWRAIPTL